jgi:hypothetical protein
MHFRRAQQLNNRRLDGAMKGVRYVAAAGEAEGDKNMIEVLMG